MLIIDADREAANALRVVLADIGGFWHKPGDDSPLCLALARHREEAEARLAEKYLRAAKAELSQEDETRFCSRSRLAVLAHRVPLAQLLP